VTDDLLGIDSDVSLRGVQVEVAEQLGGDVDWQAAVDGLGGEDAAEVVAENVIGDPSTSVSAARAASR
jgi:hypothetical protein